MRTLREGKHQHFLPRFLEVCGTHLETKMSS